MDSPNHQPYKSKLFNFVNRRSSQWRDHLIRSAQYLRVGLEWSLQILIYPLYLMIQGGRVAGQQLRQSFTQKALPTHKNKTNSSISKVDKPLRKVFKETEHCLSQSTTKQATQNHNKRTPVMIQGVASAIESHDLVLVAENNKIIDILSPIQQTHLKKYIRLETANYWHKFKQDQKNNLQSIHPFYSDNAYVLPPIRWFWQVMDWMQTGTLAINLDLFGESSLVPTTTQSNITSLSINSKVSHQENRRELLHLSSSLEQKFQQLREYIKQKNNESFNIDNEDPFRIEFLIYAAIDYFFNRFIPHHSLMADSRQKQLQLSAISDHSLMTREISNAWLSWDDLYQEIPSINRPSSLLSPSTFPSQSDPSSRQPKPSLKKRRKKRVKASRNQKTLEKSSSNLQKKSTSSKFNQKIEKNSSNWLETEAKTTGYVKHPLVRVLEWLDSAIHWLEKLVNNLTKLLRKRR
ncbi:MAG: hypothetical protein AB4063_19870 [Crocosphaera sp.]